MEISLKESEYRWLEAAKFYEEILVVAKCSPNVSAQYLERIAFCYSLSSRQAKDLIEFRNQRRLSIDSYVKAAKIYQEEPCSEDKTKALKCNALAQFTRTWLEDSPIERRRTLQDSIRLGKIALNAFEDNKDDSNAAEMENMLALCAYDLQKITIDAAERESILRQGLENSRIATAFFSHLRRKPEYISALSLSSILSTSLLDLSEKNERQELVKTCLDCSKQAIIESKNVDNHYSIAMSRWAATVAESYCEEEIEKRGSLQFPTEMLEHASIIQDSYLVGIAYYLLATVSFSEIQKILNPNEKRQRYIDIIDYAKETKNYLGLNLHNSDIALVSVCSAESFSSIAKEFATTPQKKRHFLRKAIQAAEEGLREASHSGYHEAVESNLHALSKGYYYFSSIEKSPERKIETLNLALKYRKEEIKSTNQAFPSNSWYIGVSLVYQAQIEAKLAGLEKNERLKHSLLGKAISHMSKGISLCKKHYQINSLETFLPHIANYEENLANLFEISYSFTNNKESLTRANEIYEDAVTFYGKAGLPTRVAESYWKIARNLDMLEEYSEASASFQKAAGEYTTASREIVQLSSFYKGYADYMRAWSAIASAKQSHNIERYETAKQNYEDASKLLEQSKEWSYLSTNFHAWSLLEEAEDLSRKELSTKSIDTFQMALDSLSESAKTLSDISCRIYREDEREFINRLSQSLAGRMDYTRGRILVEEAKVYGKQGNQNSSSEKYLKAAVVFKRISQTDSEVGKESKPLFYLCRAWQKMAMAEAKGAAKLFEGAAELFERANYYATKESTSLVTLGHSSFCRALKAGTEFETTHSLKKYEETLKYMTSAKNYYLKAGFEPGSNHTKAIERLFEVYKYVDSAKKEKDPQEEAKYYLMAERVLANLSDYFAKAGYTAKYEQVQQLLKSVREERELAISLGELFHSPLVTASTSTFSTIVPVEEKAIGLERFEHADIQARIVNHEYNAKIGESFDFEMEVFNVGKEWLNLSKIENLATNGIQVVDKPDYFSITDSGLEANGLRLEPLKSESIKIRLKPFQKGKYTIKPIVICVDSTGHKISCNPEPAIINVSTVVLPGRVRTGFDSLDDLLLGGFPEGYAVILMSPSSNERQELIRSFLEEGAKHNQATYYVTAEVGEIGNLIAEGLQSTCKLILCNQHADIITNQPNVINAGGVENLADINITLIKSLRMLDPQQKGPRRICISMLSDVLLQHRSVITRKWLSNIIPELKSKGFTIMAIINPRMHPPEEVQAILSLFEGEICITERETEKGFYETLKVKKMLKINYLENEVCINRESCQ